MVSFFAAQGTRKSPLLPRIVPQKIFQFHFIEALSKNKLKSSNKPLQDMFFSVIFSLDFFLFVCFLKGRVVIFTLKRS